MKAYRVVTDTLDWCGIEKGTEMEFGDDCFSINYMFRNGDHHWVVTPKELDDKGYMEAFKKHPDWFEEVKDSPLEKKDFSLKDLIDFGKFVKRGDKIHEFNKMDSIPIDALLVDEWLQKAHPEDCVQKKETPTTKLYSVEEIKEMKFGDYETFPTDSPAYKAIYDKVMRGEELFTPTEKMILQFLTSGKLT